ncbi:MAG: cold shock domain-containing protein [Rubrobacter sp.]|nr:cold shock domain-containing protein [Rubrobacter sp.]
MWFDPSVADDPIWKEHWTNVDSVVVKVAEDSIVLEAAQYASRSGSQDASLEGFSDGSDSQAAIPAVDTFSGTLPAPSKPAEATKPTADSEVAASESDRERGRVKWFDPEKGYGFLVRPTGEDLFVHHSEVDGDPSALESGSQVEYVVGRNDRGPNARGVRFVE